MSARVVYRDNVAGTLGLGRHDPQTVLVETNA
jgi:hypothetical protein